jgi:hypothetical protein
VSGNLKSSEIGGKGESGVGMEVKLFTKRSEKIDEEFNKMLDQRLPNLTVKPQDPNWKAVSLIKDTPPKMTIQD